MSLHVVVHDLHWPKLDGPTFNALMDFLMHNKIASFRFGGDQFDFECISHHTKGKGLYRTAGKYKRDLATFDQYVLTPIEQTIGKRAEKVWHIGNHERFEFDFVEEHPELEGTIDHVAQLKLVERGWKVVKLGHASRIGKLNVIHGEILTGMGNVYGIFPSRKAVELYGGNVLAGHTHAPQSYTRISPVEHTQKHMGWIAPCAGNVNPTYLQNRPTAWLNGFTLVETMDNGAFNVYPIIITKGRFSFGGTVYGA